MSKKNNQVAHFGFPICDFVFLSILTLLVLVLKYKGLGLTIPSFLRVSTSYYKEFIVIIGSWFLLSGYTRIYSGLKNPSMLNSIKKILIQLFLFLIVFLALFNDEAGLMPNSNRFQVLLLIIFVSYLLISRFAYIKNLKYRLRKVVGLYNSIMIGQNENTDELIDLILSRKDLGYAVKYVFSDHQQKFNSKINILPLSKLKSYIMKNSTDYGFISLGGEIPESEISSLIDNLQDKYIKFGFIPNRSFETKRSLNIDYLDAFPILTYKKYPLEFPFNQILKRTFDLVFSLLAFVFLLWWLLPILAIAVYFSQGRPILFSQKRNGRNGEEFNCLKFRTMRPDIDNNKKPTERDDPRVTKLGKILRKTSLDELPQFFNVLKGDMSIVGPRPHMVSENESYNEIIRRYSLRHFVKPGITGLAQIRGYRGAVDSEKDMELRVRTDIYYVRNWSFLLDLLIIYKTVRLVIVGDENAI